MCGATRADTSANKMQTDESVSERDIRVEKGARGMGGWGLAVVVGGNVGGRPMKPNVTVTSPLRL